MKHDVMFKRVNCPHGSAVQLINNQHAYPKRYGRYGPNRADKRNKYSARTQCQIWESKS